MPETVTLFTKEELWTAAYKMACGKAPRHDGNPTEVIKVVAREYPFVLLILFNSCLWDGVFCTRWKNRN